MIRLVALSFAHGKTLSIFSLDRSHGRNGSLMNALFSYGFRPFFLLASLSAASFVGTWVGRLFYPKLFSLGQVDVAWHAHEMLFGFTMAMVAGFLLTAVPNWTNTEPHKGRALVILAGLWLLGRISMVMPRSLAASIVDLAFVPTLLLFLVPPLWKRFAGKTFVFVPILGGLWAGNLLYHLEMLGLSTSGGMANLFTLTGIQLLIVIIGGRVIPFFTLKRLSSSPQRWTVVEVVSVLTILTLPFLEFFPVWVLWLWTLSVGTSHCLRAWGWYHRGVWSEPLLWVLYLGYAWIPVGGVLMGLAHLGHGHVSAGLHALTSGAIGTVGIGIMARASLGHTGRPLRAPALAVASFVLVLTASALRVLGPLSSLEPRLYLVGSGAAWSLGFLLFFVAYLPILTGPRADA